MKKITGIIFITFCVLAFGIPALAKPIVFIVAGQSTSKCGVVAEVPRAALATPPQLIEYHVIDVDYSETAYRVDSFTQRRHFGPEVRFVQLYAKAHPESEIILLKVAKNGSGMVRWSPKWPGEYDAWTGDLYRLMVRLVRDAVAERDVEWGGLLFIQGENDAARPERARVYSQNLTRLVTRLRRDISALDMPVLTSEISPAIEKYPHQFQVNQGKINAAMTTPGVRVVSNSGLGYREDGVHYTSNAVLNLGARFFQVFN